MSLEISEETTFLLDMINFQFGPVMNVSNCENLSYTTFANATPTGFDATSNGGATHRAGTADEITIVSGRSYLIEFDEVLNGGGTAPIVSLRESLAANLISNVISSANGSNAITLVAIGTATGVLGFHNSSTVTDFEITNLSVREIL